ncbi:alpha-hydroxy-acid oxidizing protein [Luteipulveratus mongoliensis]|uniref:Lactate 2-monooxygenase n=1 Tax=Luteipulveratus mongoliensis TaxID=571913 RepID=A0A0K1JNL7_9MICO|nr:alpha-hydroxy-acid oxidizing protein [Luteipulveratus mongoliensis]AKU18180.1 lactate 2-monooxygenase [Luteipulveratus mongoliensis]
MTEASAPEGIGRRIQAQIYRRGVFGYRPAVPVSPDVLETKAYAAMSPTARSYIHTGAGRGDTMSANRDAFDQWRIVPRMMRDTQQRDQSIELFGRRLDSPFLTAPIGVSEMAHPDGDLALARGARAAGVPVIISTQASQPMEDICAELGDQERWYQLYWSKDDELVESLVRRAERAGCTALVVTLDTTLLGWRVEDLDLAWLPFARGMGIAQYTSDPVFQRLVQERVANPTNETDDQPRPRPGAVRSLAKLSRTYPGSTLDNLRSPEPRAAVETFLDVFSRLDLTWERLAWLRERTSLPILVKGIQHPDDAELALEHGVDGIVVSNHGGRQVDGAIGSLAALPGVVDVVAGRVPVLFDSGIRCAADAFKALALGATAVCIGRPWVWGLALGGADGVQQVLETYRAELDLQMNLTGVTSIGEITPETIVPA